MYRQMKVAGLTVDPFTHSPIMILKDEENDDSLPIWIGPLEATAIASELEGVSFSRPMTHDLLSNVINSLKAKLVRIDICDLRNNTFYARLHITVGENKIIIDSRPSDAIALALRNDAPIFVSQDVLDRSSRAEEQPGGQAALDDEASKEYAEMLDGMDPDEFGKYKM